MNRRILLFNAVYYAVIISFIVKVTKNDSDFLGPTILMLFFLAIAFLFLIILIIKSAIPFKSAMDKVGVFMATPVPTAIFFIIFFPQKKQEPLCIYEYFTRNNYHYLKKTYYDNNTKDKSIEYYLTADSSSLGNNTPNEVLIKDSTWVYLSQNGDTLKVLKYKNGSLVK